SCWLLVVGKTQLTINQQPTTKTKWIQKTYSKKFEK
ncbi:MAG: hypothetical protein RL308_557, partial [Bacteroidota bacterium]